MKTNQMATAPAAATCPKCNQVVKLNSDGSLKLHGSSATERRFACTQVLPEAKSDSEHAALVAVAESAQRALAYAKDSGLTLGNLEHALANLAAVRNQ